MQSSRPAETRTAADSAAAGTSSTQLMRAIALCSVAFIASSGLASWLTSDEDQSVVGFVEAERCELRAQQAGRVNSLLVKPGELVHSGAPVLVYELAELEQSITQLQQQIAGLEDQCAQAQARADVELAWRLKDLDSEILQAKIDAAGFLKEQFTSQLKHRALSSVMERGVDYQNASLNEPVVRPLVFTPTPRSTRVQTLLEQQEAVNAVEVYGVQIEICDARVSRLEKLKAALSEQVDAACGVDRLERELTVARDELLALKSKSAKQQLLANGHGVVTQLSVSAGQQLAAGDLVAEFYDRQRRFITAQVPSELAHRFAAETQVKVFFAGDEPYAGTVVGSPLQAESQPLTAAGSAVMVPVRIEPAGKLWPDVAFGSAVSIQVPREL